MSARPDCHIGPPRQCPNGSGRDPGDRALAPALILAAMADGEAKSSIWAKAMT